MQQEREVISTQEEPYLAALNTMPQKDEYWAEIGEPMREAGARLSLLGMHIAAITEMGDGAHAYPMFIVEPTMTPQEQAEWKHYQRIKETLAHNRNAVEILSDIEKAQIKNVEERLAEGRALLLEKLTMLLDSYYATRDQSEIEGLERLAVTQNDTGEITVAPIGANVWSTSAHDNPEENERRSKLYEAEVARFAEFLRARH